jgi:hypothetical protein
MIHGRLLRSGSAERLYRLAWKASSFRLTIIEVGCRSTFELPSGAIVNGHIS